MFQTGIGVAKFFCLAGCLALAGLSFANAMRLGQQDGTLGIVFSSLAMVWSAAVVATLMKRWHELAMVALCGLMLSAGLGLSIMLAVPAVQQSANLIWALFLEGLVLFAAMWSTARFFKHGQSAATP